LDRRIAVVPHFRLPAFAPGVTSFVWALVLAFYVWIGLLAIGTSQATAFVVAAVAGFFIFVFVRLRGSDLRDVE
jgi:hypothetical protein